MRLTAVFCRHHGFLSKVTGELENVSGIDDPRLRRLIRQMVPLLFPPVDPTRDGDEEPFLISRGGLRGRGARLSAVDPGAPAGDRLAVNVRAQGLGRTTERTGRGAKRPRLSMRSYMTIAPAAARLMQNRVGTRTT
jgi:hypothetical protein